MPRKEYDFLTWTSFPSSIKYVNETGDWWSTWLFKDLPVTPGGTLTLEVNARKAGVRIRSSNVVVYGFTEAGGERWLGVAALGRGTVDWAKYGITNPGTGKIRIPADIVRVGVVVRAAPGVTWLDDLKIYQDDVLIHVNDFSNWNPYIGAVAGMAIGGLAVYATTRRPAGSALGALVASLIGGAIGYATATP